jgi:hypothetical protein
MLYDEAVEDNLRYVIGLDLGQASDYSAMSFVEMHQQGESKPTFDVTYLHRWPLGTPYPKIVEGVGKLLGEDRFMRRVHGGRYTEDRKELRHPITLAVDATGVGRPVVDMFRDAHLPGSLQSITITGGHVVTSVNGGYNVPKRLLVSTLQVALQTKRLKIAAQLPEAVTLKTELQNFQLTITESANDTYEGRKGTHDDLVLAVALSLWSGQHGNTTVTASERAIAAVMADRNTWMGRG